MRTATVKGRPVKATKRAKPTDEASVLLKRRKKTSASNDSSSTSNSPGGSSPSDASTSSLGLPRPAATVHKAIDKAQKSKSCLAEARGAKKSAKKPKKTPVNFHRAIKASFKEYVAETGTEKLSLDKSTVDVCNSLLLDLAKRILHECYQLLQMSRRDTLKAQDLKSAISLLLPRGLQRETRESVERALMRFDASFVEESASRKAKSGVSGPSLRPDPALTPVSEGTEEATESVTDGGAGFVGRRGEDESEFEFEDHSTRKQSKDRYVDDGDCGDYDDGEDDAREYNDSDEGDGGYDDGYDNCDGSDADEAGSEGGSEASRSPSDMPRQQYSESSPEAFGRRRSAMRGFGSPDYPAQDSP